MRINKWILVALAMNIILLLLYSMRSQAANLEKDINSYVGEVKLSDTRMSIRLTFDDANIGTLKISRWNKRLGKTKIEESYFASLEADTLTLAGEIFYDIKYLFKREKERSYIYAINDSPDGVLFYDKSIRRIELKGKKETNADSLFVSRIIDGDFFDQEHSEKQDYNLVIRHCWSHTDESYDGTLSEGLSRMLRKYPQKIEGLRKALKRLPPKQREKANYEMMVLIVSAWMMEQDSDSIEPKSFYHTYPFFKKSSMIDRILMEQKLKGVCLPDSIAEQIENYYNYKNTNASKNVVNLISPNNYNFVDGIYAFKGMGPHFPRQIFVYKREKIFIFNSRGDYNPEGVIMEFCSCIKKLNLTHKEIVDYLNVICLYLQEEEVTDYGDTIK